MQTEGILRADGARAACNILTYPKQGASIACALGRPPRPNSSHESSYNYEWPIDLPRESSCTGPTSAVVTTTGFQAATLSLGIQD